MWTTTYGGSAPLVRALHRERDQTVDELGDRQPARFPKHGVHADRGETWDRVDLVEIELTRFLVEKEIDPRHSSEIERPERADRDLLDLGERFLVDIRWDVERRAIVDVLGGVVVELVAGHYFARDGGDRSVVAEHRDFELARVD